MAVATALHVQYLNLWYWIDEGIAIGISSFELTDIPTVLQQDGSPPLYYLLLHLWMSAFGDTEPATRALSVLFAVLSVPAGFWAGRIVGGRRAAWIAAVLAATNPFLTQYAAETRMYTLLALLSLVATGALVSSFVHRQRRHLPVLAACLAAALYTHNWGLFLFLGCGGAVLVRLLLAPARDRRPIFVDAALTFGAAGLAYLPWIPTVLHQRRSTGVPTFSSPDLFDFLHLSVLVEGQVLGALLLVAVGSGYLVVVKGPRSTEWVTAVVLVALPGVAVLAGWLSSQSVPAWHFRYFAAVLGPVLVGLAFGLARAGGLGLASTVVVALIWAHPFGNLLYRPPLHEKSNAAEIAQELGPRLREGDLVVSPEPAEVPVLSYYLPTGLGYATSMGVVPDPRVVDHRGITERIERITVDETLPPLLDDLPVGARILLVQPERVTDRLPPIRTQDRAEVLADDLETTPEFYETVFAQSDLAGSLLADRDDLRLVGRLDAPHDGVVTSPPLDALLYEKESP